MVDHRVRGRVDAWLAAERPIRFQVRHLVLPLGRAYDVMVYLPNGSEA